MKDSKTKPKPIGAWAEISPDGEVLFCYSGRKHGGKFEERLTLKEIEEFIKDCLKNKNAKQFS